uniref:uncharacterized protein K02A2.6-like n=1 Tax=Styela clava TaxID=7725 RepID=UPI00193A8814|nr:uncharacterized protein K02A2.6-like [Styela clava]
MFIADTLSRAYIDKSTDTIGKGDIFHLSLANEIEEIDMLKDIPVLDKTMHVLQKSTEIDSTMQTLRALIEDGWPITKKQLPRSMQEYFNFREDLTVQNGLILKGCRIVVPESAKQYVRQRIHASHIGIQACIRRAREVLFWPKMASDIHDYVSPCTTCRVFQPNQQKEPIIHHEIPSRPWQIIASDLFELQVDRLHTTTSAEVIKALKQHMARHGLPGKLISDNAPQYSSEEFRRFAEDYEFQHVTSSSTWQSRVRR